MCGLSFYCTKKGERRAFLEASLQAISHRGPDDRGLFTKKIKDYWIGFGHNRLSILDLSSAAKQPMSIPGYTLIYNGEIYNHQALREQLIQKGYHFQTHSDTEIILSLFAAFGVQAFSYLNGMFAFVLLDEACEKVYLVRDHLGIKPLYLAKTPDGLFGSSEIRGLKVFPELDQSIDAQDIFEFFNQGFLYEPSTGYSNIKKLLPAHYMVYDLKTAQSSLYPFKTAPGEKTKSLLKKLNKAVSEQLIADVPLGTFFSGGLDSSLLASLAPNSALFFAKYEKDQSADRDAHFAAEISKHLNKSLTVADLSATAQEPEAFLDAVDFVAAHTEELISDFTFWPTYQLSLAARKEGYKVMLSGMGADEIFCGYPRYLVLKYHAFLRILGPALKYCLRLKLFPKRWDKKFERLVSYSSEAHWPTAYTRLLGYFSRADLRGFFSNFSQLDVVYQTKLNALLANFQGRARNKVKAAQFLDRYGYLSHNLMVADKASMLAGLELRVPLLDEAVVACGLDLPVKQLMKGGQFKYPLQKILAQYLPSAVIKRPKTGFNPPLEGLIHRLGKARLRQELAPVEKAISLAPVDDMLNAHFSGEANYTYKLWQLLYFSRWIKHHAPA